MLEPHQVGTAMLLQARRLDPLGQHPAERIRREQLSRVVGKLDLSPEEEKTIERLSYSLVAGVLLGLVPEVVARARSRTSSEERGEKLAILVAGGALYGGRKRDGQVR